ncbi:MAG TPA: hypothetical protein P5136_02785 [Methanofastidiosum sp.]|nr:hypothetical protein [Methanofastidiosum sp.]
MKILCLLSNKTDSFLSFKSFSLNQGRTVLNCESAGPDFCGILFECKSEILPHKNFFEGEFEYIILPYLSELNETEETKLLKIKFRARMRDDVLQFHTFPEINNNTIFECIPVHYNWGKRESEALLVFREK